MRLWHPGPGERTGGPTPVTVNVISEENMRYLSLSLLVAVKIVMLLVVLMLNGCSGTEETGTPSSAAPPEETGPPPAAVPPVVTGTAIRLSPVATGLSNPDHIPTAGAERLFLVEQQAL